MKQNFSFEKHDECSRELQRTSDYLAELVKEISNSYGKNTEIAKKAKKSLDEIISLRFSLADELHKESPHELVIGALDFYQRQNNQQ
ncbi:hypothetical protein [Providencia vermicola]|uniref:hypothetical protein n=1 Tax=Providencia vermicola TaxID=333965 RepID=UPI003D267AF5